MSVGRDKLNRQLLEAVDRKDVGKIERLVKQDGADVNCRESHVCYCLRGQVVVCGKSRPYFTAKSGRESHVGFLVGYLHC